MSRRPSWPRLWRLLSLSFLGLRVLSILSRFSKNRLFVSLLLKFVLCYRFYRFLLLPLLPLSSRFLGVSFALLSGAEEGLRAPTRDRFPFVWRPRQTCRSQRPSRHHFRCAPRTRLCRLFAFLEPQAFLGLPETSCPTQESFESVSLARKRPEILLHLLP